MTDAQLARLSPRRRECLRLLNDGLRAKEIAQRLQIEEMTVRDHLKAARAALGVSDSLTVARLLADYERRHPQNVGMAAPQPIAPPDRTDATGGGSRPRPRSGQVAGIEPFPLERASSPMGAATAKQPLRSLLFPPLDRPPNDLSPREKIRIIGLELLIVVAGSAGIVCLLMLVNWYLAALKTHGG